MKKGREQEDKEIESRMLEIKHLWTSLWSENEDEIRLVVKKLRDKNDTVFGEVYNQEPLVTAWRLSRLVSSIGQAIGYDNKFLHHRSEHEHKR